MLPPEGNLARLGRIADVLDVIARARPLGVGVSGERPDRELTLQIRAGKKPV